MIARLALLSVGVVLVSVLLALGIGAAVDRELARRGSP